MTPDWAARPITVPYAVFGDPQSLNLYGYVRNDPVTSVDADGHQKRCGNEVYCGEVAQELDNKQAGDTTSTAQNLSAGDQAAIATLDKINPQSIKESAEYSANVYGNKDGTASTTDPARYPQDSRAQSESPAPDPSAIPRGTTYLGDLHTHGSGHVVINGREAQTDPEHFSSDDRKTSWATSRKVGHVSPGYLETPSGTIKKFTPTNINNMIPGSGTVTVLNRQAGSWEPE